MNLYDKSDEFESVGELHDPNADYSFHTILLVRDLKTRKYYAAVDSGCSCPSPFEGHTYPTDFAEVRSAAEFREYVKSCGDIWHTNDVDSLAALIKRNRRK